MDNFRPPLEQIVNESREVLRQHGHDVTRRNVRINETATRAPAQTSEPAQMNNANGGGSAGAVMPTSSLDYPDEIEDWESIGSETKSNKAAKAASEKKKWRKSKKWNNKKGKGQKKKKRRRRRRRRRKGKETEKMTHKTEKKTQTTEEKTETKTQTTEEMAEKKTEKPEEVNKPAEPLRYPELIDRKHTIHYEIYAAHSGYMMAPPCPPYTDYPELDWTPLERKVQLGFEEPPRQVVQVLRMKKLGAFSLINLFYEREGTIIQFAAACELYNREWKFYQANGLWYQRLSEIYTPRVDEEYEVGFFIYFDLECWKIQSTFARLEREKIIPRLSLSSVFVYKRKQPPRSKSRRSRSRPDSADEPPRLIHISPPRESPRIITAFKYTDYKELDFAPPNLKQDFDFVETPPLRFQFLDVRKLGVYSLLSLFYRHGGHEIQMAAAYELNRRGWGFYSVNCYWYVRMSILYSNIYHGDYDVGYYLYFNPDLWEIKGTFARLKRSNFCPQLPHRPIVKYEMRP